MSVKAKHHQGFVLPMVVMIIAIITMLIFAASVLVDNMSALTLHYRGQERGLGFAEAGINEYLWHLNHDANFYYNDLNNSHIYINGDGTPKVRSFENGRYKLEITPPGQGAGEINLKATGWAADDPRNTVSVNVTLRKREFTNYIWLTQDETDADGNVVYWTSGDHVMGPLHTNGTLHIDGNPEFDDQVTYSTALDVSSRSRPNYHLERNQPPQAVPKLVFPASNSNLKLTALTNGTCYEGRTCIYLADGGYYVTNRKVNNGARTWVTYPSNGVIYIDGQSANEGNNYKKYNDDTANLFISGTFSGQLTIAAANDIYLTGKDPTLPYDSAASESISGIKYNDPQHDLLGLIAANYIHILQYGWPTMMDESYYKKKNWKYDRDHYQRCVAPTNINIDAVLFAIKYSFDLEGYDDAPLLGNINLLGSIIQNKRGSVGTFDRYSGDKLSGYNKLYTYDRRLANTAPPSFLEPLNSGWSIATWRKVPSN